VFFWLCRLPVRTDMVGTMHTGSNGILPEFDKKHVPSSPVNDVWDTSTDIFEYTSSANPYMSPIPAQNLDASAHTTGASRVTSLDISKSIGIEGYPASSPNLLASFVRICVGESYTTNACATSQVELRHLIATTMFFCTLVICQA
jgi:hypothetical protein